MYICIYNRALVGLQEIDKYRENSMKNDQNR